MFCTMSQLKSNAVQPTNSGTSCIIIMLQIHRKLSDHFL